MEQDKDLGQPQHFRADNSNKWSAPRGPTKPPTVHPGNRGNYGDYAKRSRNSIRSRQRHSDWIQKLNEASEYNRQSGKIVHPT